jgi:hypothetical protein
MDLKQSTKYYLQSEIQNNYSNNFIGLSHETIGEIIEKLAENIVDENSKLLYEMLNNINRDAHEQISRIVEFKLTNFLSNY